MTLTGTRNFSVREWDAKSTGGYTPDVYRANAQRTLEQLQRIRDALGVPVIITDAWRSSEDNAHTAGSAPKSQHLTADAADFVVPSLTKREVAARLDAAEQRGELGTFRQLIYYLTDSHYHVGTGAGNQKLVKVDTNTYRPYAGADALPASLAPSTREVLLRRSSFLRSSSSSSPTDSGASNG